jgi:transcriptional regulator GlxA family with amidase domain
MPYHLGKRNSKDGSIRTIGILGYADVQALDLIGPADAFAIANEHLRARGSTAGYKVVVLGLNRRTFAAESGVLLKPHATLDGAPSLDTLLISGGRGLRVREQYERVANWIRERDSSIRRIASICTGIYALAATGLLNGKRVTTHWKFARDVAQRFPLVQVDANAIFIKAGKFYTAAGITSGIDLALALTEEDHGPELALGVARELVVYFKRPGGQEQYSEPLQFQTRSSDRLSDLVPWMSAHLKQNLSVEALAERARLSPRHFTRRFKEAFGRNPGEFVEKLRLDEARHRLTNSGSTIESVADSIGFGSADSFRRAFERRFGVAPSVYRGRFATAQKLSWPGRFN